MAASSTSARRRSSAVSAEWSSLPRLWASLQSGADGPQGCYSRSTGVEFFQQSARVYDGTVRAGHEHLLSKFESLASQRSGSRIVALGQQQRPLELSDDQVRAGAKAAAELYRRLEVLVGGVVVAESGRQYGETKVVGVCDGEAGPVERSGEREESLVGMAHVDSVDRDPTAEPADRTQGDRVLEVGWHVGKVVLGHFAQVFHRVGWPIAFAQTPREGDTPHWEAWL